MVVFTVSSKALLHLVKDLINESDPQQRLYKLTLKTKSLTVDNYDASVKIISSLPEKKEVMVNIDALLRITRILELLDDQPITLAVDPEDKNSPFTISNAVI